MKTFKERCIELRKQDKSIIEIMQITGRSKSSVYTHIRDIPLSPARVHKTKEAAGERIRKFALARKGKSVRTFKKFAAWDVERVSLVAHLLFDGGIYPRHGVVYNNRSMALLRHVETHMRSMYAFEPARYQNLLTGVSRITYHNVALAGYLKIKSEDLLKKVESLSFDCKREFIRAFFDDEGCIDYRPNQNKRSIRGYQKDTTILYLVQNLLNDLDIASKVVAPNEVVITSKKDLIAFETLVNFSKGVYINGNRSNSRWKKHIEKRQILRMAIESFTFKIFSSS